MKSGRARSSQAKGQSSLKQFAAPSIEALISAYSGYKLLLIHPSNRYRTLLISALIDIPTAELFYYDLGAEDDSLAQFLNGLLYALANQASTFGTNLREAMTGEIADPRVLAEAFAQDLDLISKDHYLLILDEYDRADRIAEVNAFIENLLDLLPAQCHILISSRTLPRLPWVAMMATNQAVVLQDSGILPDRFYAENLGKNPTLEAHALGPGYLLVDGQLVNTWEGDMQKLMFFFALDSPLSTRADICRAFWPPLSVDQAVNVFHVTKRRLHKALGFDVLLHDGTFYQISPRLNLHYDVLEFVTSLVEARGKTGNEAERYWKRAIEQYQGSYLQGRDESWIVARRADFREGYIEALRELAHIREGQQQDEIALGLSLRALNEASHREDLHREVILLYGKLGRKDEAAAHYNRLLTDLKEQYDIEPSPETQKIYREVIR